MYSCLTIMKSSNEIEKTLYESSNSSISITKKDGKYFNVNQFKDIEKIKEVEKIIIQYDGLAKLKDAKVVSGEQRINREDLSDEFKNVVSLEATNNTKRNILFSSRVFTITEGKNIEEKDKNSIIVHEEFAKQNNLKLGDEVDLGSRRERRKSPSPGRNPQRNSFRNQRTAASVFLPIISTC